MCRDNSFKPKDKVEYLQRYDLDEMEYYNFTYHRIAGTPDWPIVIYDSVENRNRSVSAHWGLIPHWTKSKAEGVKSSFKFNDARRETIKEMKLFKPLITKQQRCLVPSTGFFEHYHPNPSKKDNIPFIIQLRENHIFSIAGIWTTWKNYEDDSVITSFAMITTAANELMANIHNAGPHGQRMPLVLKKEMEAQWLDRATPENIIDDILNYRVSSEELKAWPVASVRKKHEDDECVWAEIPVSNINFAYDRNLPNGSVNANPQTSLNF